MRLTNRWLMIAGLLVLVMLPGCQRSDEAGVEKPHQAKCYSLSERYSLSPDGAWLLIDIPSPRLINVAEAQTLLLRNSACQEMPHYGWTWCPDSSGFIFRRLDNYVHASFYFCEVPSGSCTRIDTASITSMASRTVHGAIQPVSLTYVSTNEVLVVFTRTYTKGVVRPHVAIARLKDHKLHLLSQLQKLEVDPQSSLMCTPYTDRSRNYALIWMHALSGSTIGRIGLHSLQLRPLLFEQRIRDLMGVEEADFKGSREKVGDLQPAMGGAWAFALLRSTTDAYPQTLVRLRLDSGKVEKTLPLPEARWPIAASADGLHLAYAERTGDNTRLVVCNQDGEEKRYLTDGTHQDEQAIWNDARDEIIFQRDKERICAISSKGGIVRTLSE